MLKMGLGKENGDFVLWVRPVVEEWLALRALWGSTCGRRVIGAARLVGFDLRSKSEGCRGAIRLIRLGGDVVFLQKSILPKHLLDILRKKVTFARNQLNDW